jgi:chitin synthase
MSTSYPDLIQLPDIQNDAAEESILQLLQTRFKADQPYTQLGSNRLIVVNPQKPLELLNDTTLETYGQHGYKDLQPENLRSLEPHVYDMATQVYLLMRRRGEAQTILLRYIFNI